MSEQKLRNYEIRIIDPEKITIQDCPLVVFSHNPRSLFGFLTNKRTQGEYSHVMLMIAPGWFASQSWNGFKQVSVKKYLNERLKFWQIITDEYTRNSIYLEVMQELKKPFWRNRYDFLGILGQLTGLRWLNAPYLEYCSEKVAQFLRLVPYLKNYPKQLNPSEMNKQFSLNPITKYFGHYFPKD